MTTPYLRRSPYPRPRLALPERYFLARSTHEGRHLQIRFLIVLHTRSPINDTHVDYVNTNELRHSHTCFYSCGTCTTWIWPYLTPTFLWQIWQNSDLFFKFGGQFCKVPQCFPFSENFAKFRQHFITIEHKHGDIRWKIWIFKRTEQMQNNLESNYWTHFR